MAHAGIHLLLDYDGTLTTRDTIAVIANIGYSAAAVGFKDPPSRSWDSIVNAYGEDYRAHVAGYKPAKEDRTTVEQELDFLASLKPVERGSIERVEGAGVFSGLTKELVEQGAERAVREGDVRLRDGWKELISRVAEDGKVGIVSVGWSRTFIRRCLIYSACLAEDDAALALLQNMPIAANEIDGLGSGYPATGKMDRYFADEGAGVWTAADKLRVMRELMEDQETAKTVYIGDSSTDLACLLEADIGIIIRDDPMRSGQEDLAACLQRLQIPIRPIASYENGPDISEDSSKRYLWWASDFKEIMRIGLFRKGDA